MSERRDRPISDDEARDWQSEFPAAPETVHLANCSHGPQSRRVRRSLEGYLNSWRTSGMDWDLWMSEVEAAKAAFAALVSAEPGEIAVSTSASAAVASFASALEPRGDRRRVVTSEAEFPTVAHVWRAAARWGLDVGFVPLRNGELSLADYESRISEETLVVSATHVYYKDGLKQDLRRIGQLARERGALFLVDAYQSLGTCDIDVRELGIDVLVCGAQKYLLGVPGVAFLYVRGGLAQTLEPAVTGWFGRADPFAFDPRRLDYASGTRRFETGTPPVFAAVAARAGMELVSAVGLRRVERRMEELSRGLIERAGELGLDYAGPLDVSRKGATCAIRVPNPHAVEERLKGRGVVTAARGDVIRLAPHFFTTSDDLERAITELRHVLDASV